MKTILKWIVFAAIMFLVGWLFANDEMPFGIVIMVIWFFSSGMIWEDNGYGLIWGSNFGLILGSILTAHIINECVFKSQGEIHTIAYVSDRGAFQSTSTQGVKNTYVDFSTTFTALIAYPSFGIIQNNYIQNNFEESTKGHLDNSCHPLSDTIIISFAISQPKKYKILNAHPSKSELEKYQNPQYYKSKKILEGNDAMQEIKKHSKYNFDSNAEPDFYYKN